jgi:hypothetical protein
MKFGRAEFWTAFFTGALAGATFYALLYARAQINESHQEAQVQHLLVLEQQYEQEPMATYRRRFAAARLKGEGEPDDLYKVLDFFETVGIHHAGPSKWHKLGATGCKSGGHKSSLSYCSGTTCPHPLQFYPAPVLDLTR